MDNTITLNDTPLLNEDSFNDYNNLEELIRGKNPDLRKGPSIYESDDTTGVSTSAAELDYKNNFQR